MENMTFDFSERRAGAALRDEGIARVTNNTPEAYQDRFLQELNRLVREGYQFTSEDITATIGMPPNHPNAVGAILNGATKSGLIRRVGYVQSVRPRSHAAVISLWEGAV